MKKWVASFIDHTLLKPTCTSADIERLCLEAMEYRFAAVCVPLFSTGQAHRILQSDPAGGVGLATVIGFPMGYTTLQSKQTEVREAIAMGAGELDVVINLIALKDGNWNYLREEIETLTRQIHKEKKIIKVIVESGVLTETELKRCCDTFGPVGIDYMKTSTGYAEKGASLGDVQKMRAWLPDSVKIKASGGIRHYDFAWELIEAGADRIGCSASLQIVQEEKKEIMEKS